MYTHQSIVYRDKSIGAKYYVNDIFNDDASILKEEVKIQFRNFCLNYLNSLIAPVGKRLNRVHLVFDSRSWRKSYTREFFEKSNFETNVAPTEFKYKGNRKKDDKIFLFFDYFQNEIVPKLIEETGINYYRVDSTEGDDILAYLCNVIDGDIMIYTVDSDIIEESRFATARNAPSCITVALSYITPIVLITIGNVSISTIIICAALC